MLSKGSLFIVSAPSGAGKTTLLKALEKMMPKVCVSISFTTRQMRSHEQNGIDYHFVSREEFEAMLLQNVFLEHACVFGNFYGTSSVWVEATRHKGLDVVLEIDWQGAQQVRTQFLDAKSIFILPPTFETLFERLQKRHSDNEAVIQKRMNEAKEELSHYCEYDYLICNNQFEVALKDLQSIIQCHRLHQSYAMTEQRELIQKLLS